MHTVQRNKILAEEVYFWLHCSRKPAYRKERPSSFSKCLIWHYSSQCGVRCGSGFILSHRIRVNIKIGLWVQITFPQRCLLKGRHPNILLPPGFWVSLVSDPLGHFGYLNAHVLYSSWALSSMLSLLNSSSYTIFRSSSHPLGILRIWFFFFQR